MTTAECRSCGAAIIWTRTRSGKRMPVDATPVTPEEGGIELIDDADRDHDHTPLASTLGFVARAARAAEGVPIYRSHFASCPNAAQFRRKPA